MNSKFSIMLVSAAMTIFLISCGGGGESKNTSTTDTSATNTATTTPETKPANTTVTTPQNMLVVKHKVADFAKWMVAYEGHDSARLADGLHSYVIGRGLKDSNMVLVAMKVDDVEKAKAFAKDPGLKKAMQKGGVVGAPTFLFYTATFQDTATIDTDLRSRTDVTVKDWDTWQKAFDSARQVNTDNGLKLRVYGHAVDDNKKVTVVSAITDTAKAMAYWKSDMLKQRMKISGVTGTPDRFLYRLVKVYK